MHPGLLTCNRPDSAWCLLSKKDCSAILCLRLGLSTAVQAKHLAHVMSRFDGACTPEYLLCRRPDGARCLATKAICGATLCASLGHGSVVQTGHQLHLRLAPCKVNVHHLGQISLVLLRPHAHPRPHVCTGCVNTCTFIQSLQCQSLTPWPYYPCTAAASLAPPP